MIFLAYLKCSTIKNNYVPQLKGKGLIVFGIDPIRIGVALSCMQIRIKFALI